VTLASWFYGPQPESFCIPSPMANMVSIATNLAILDDARSLTWGYVAYPPVTPFLARIAFILFGPSLIGLRFFAAVALGIVLVVTGLMACHLGGGRQAQIVAALAAAIGGVAFSGGALFMYVSFDYLWWVAAAYFMVRLLASDDPRWCLAVGAAIGLGMLTKYTMMFLAVGIAAGFLFTPARRYLRSPWLWCGVAIAFVIFLPNCIWQIQHHFVSLDFLRSIHARDIRIGRTDRFVLNQFWSATNPATVPLWLAGLFYLFATQDGKRYRPIGWMFIIPFVLFVIGRGRGTIWPGAIPCCSRQGRYGASGVRADGFERDGHAFRSSIPKAEDIGHAAASNFWILRVQLQILPHL